MGLIWRSLPTGTKKMNQNWYAIYTKYNAEETLRTCIENYSRLNDLNYQTYLPLRQEIKQWSDRRKVSTSPLFNNYLFTRHDDEGFSKIKNMPGFSYYIRFGSQPSIIPEQEMVLIKAVISYQQNTFCLPHKLAKGDAVKICKGALAGYEGILLKDQSSPKLAIAVKSLKLFLNVEVSMTDVVPLFKKTEQQPLCIDNQLMTATN